VRIIGEARARYREDPLRMLRAVRFAAKTGFSIDERTRKPIRELAHLLGNVPPSRVYEEMQKLLLSGHAATGLRELRSESLHHGLLPLLDVISEQPLGERFVSLALEQTDGRVRSGKSVSPAFLFAALLWHEVLAAWKKAQQRGLKPIPALYEAMDAVLDIQTDKLAIPRRLTAVMKEIWALQPRFEQRSGRRPFGLLAHERFRAAFDFLVLRSGSGEAPEELSQWWEKFQHAGEAERQAMLMAPQPGEQRRRRRRRRRKSALPPPGPAQA
jgi:poly(A) polymerase